MELLLIIGLLCSLFGTPLLLALYRQKGIDSLTYYPRISLWILAILVLMFSYMGTDLWTEKLGFSAISWRVSFIAFVATILLVVSWPLLQYAQKIHGVALTEESKTFAQIINKSSVYRIFLVITAAVTEEIFYRGYAIGVGEYILGDIWPALILSIAVFTLGHIRWGFSHLLLVFWAALVLSSLFVYTQNLWVCIIVHICIDSVGFIVMPAIRARQNEGNVR